MDWRVEVKTEVEIFSAKGNFVNQIKDNANENFVQTIFQPQAEV